MLKEEYRREAKERRLPRNAPDKNMKEMKPGRKKKNTYRKRGWHATKF